MWIIHRKTLGTCLCTFAWVAGCDRFSASQGNTIPMQSAGIAASNSYIEAAVTDLLGNDVPVLRLAEPGMCPGHFDIRPSQIEALRNCRILLRFDFQSSIDAQLGNLSRSNLSIHGIRPEGGLCEPSCYLKVCRQVAEPLIAGGFLSQEKAVRRLSEIQQRIDNKAAWCKQQMINTQLVGKPVVCSDHQEAFCQWLGLKVAATLGGADRASIDDIERAIKQGSQTQVQLIIANLPEGRRLADALAARLKARVVVFGNFPGLGNGRPSYDDLLTTNVLELIEVTKH